MMRFPSNLKKVLLIGTIILLGCDVTLLFAAPTNQPTSNSVKDPQLEQLQSQVQAQIQALQGGNGANVPNNTGNSSQAGPSPAADAVGASLANNILSQQQTGASSGSGSQPTPAASASQQASSNNLLPPSPFNDVPTSPTPDALPANLAATAQAVPTQSAPPLSNAGQVGALSSQQAAIGAGSNTPPANAQPVSDNDLNDAAFNAMVQSAMPMSPQQIQKLHSIYLDSQFAAASSSATPPRPTATSIFVDLSPGSTPPVVRLAQGFVTSLVFVDSTGAPWPIESYDIGNPSAFNIQWDKTSNTLMVQSTVLYTYGNIAVKLKGLDTPVMLTLIPGQKAVDYRVDMRIQGFGPNAKPLLANTLPASTSSDLLNVLDGVPPANSQALKVEGGDCQAWLSGSKMYVRTRLTILSPGWTATLSSADDMHAYEMQPSPMLLVSQNGEVIQLKVEGF